MLDLLPLLGIFGVSGTIAAIAFFAYRSGEKAEIAKIDRNNAKVKDEQLKKAANRPSGAGLIDRLRNGTF